ncbi:MAG TPA: hypothetical protein VFW06_08735 [Acidimicrobiia bacterium]|nr:hypothetical protein [Acidimicrobiia bacterium]
MRARHGHQKRGRSRARGERGDSLVEVLMTVVIAGIAVVSLLYGLATTINLSGVDRSNANVRTLLTSSSESVKSQTYVNCATTSSYSPSSGVTVPSGWSTSNITVALVRYWDGTAFVSTCPGTDQKLQLVRVRVVSPDGRADGTIDVVKRSSS